MNRDRNHDLLKAMFFGTLADFVTFDISKKITDYFKCQKTG